MENLFFIGVVGVILTFVIGLTQARPYSEDNQEVMGKLQRKLCISYTAFFGALALGSYNFFAVKEWWAWAIIVVSAMMAVGSFLEAQQKYPNAPKGYGKDQ